ncbi:MAG: hypothetical protein A2W90_18215 [Bacteroidetes bacterium GWF2_42_66]|nr:MAG: hypothetical protein A2W92_11700 [Bacteroidetes bacterium GWA2_42_15]OFX98188.1 MAG: hypothetical protein A2W89_09705 [Bacteroidetes bacterium GWE2_42_39]OFY42573.1 MAG: hypothetical protein A2W90_18215 [Bacteroidetes bacterium GWF2_42_66]HBL74289.1 hypothetical protein [Prolixibacteraceae bacterium]HCU64058.1 hypothetical protein [Prolixibacteraceae bacterium]
MDEKISTDDKKVLLVKDANDGKVKAVTCMDEKGIIQTEEPTAKNQRSLFAVNTNEAMLETFFKKMVEQAQQPSHTGFFLMTEKMLDKLVKIGLDPHELELHRVDPAEYLGKVQKQNPQQNQGGGDETFQSTFQPMDVSKIDRQELRKYGINAADLEPHLKAMSYGHKSPQMIPLNPELEPGIRVPTKGRVSLEEQDDGSLKIIPHYWQEKPNLDAPFHGILLSEQDKENLRQSLNAGRVIELEPAPGQKIPAFVSLDRLTNKLEAMPVENISVPNKIKGAGLSDDQQRRLGAGEKVMVEKMVSRTGRFFDGYIQINASDRKFDFTYEGLDRNRYSKENKEVRSQQKENAPEGETEKQKQLFIPKKLLGVELTEKQQEFLKAGQATYVKGMRKDDKGEPFNAWVKPNPEKMKFDFFRWNPDKAKKQGAEVKPAEESKTQVAVNNEGKTNEATKNVREPLKQGQQKPTEDQVKEQKQHARTPAAKKSGIKI